MSNPPEQDPDRIKVHIVTPEERDREIESSELRALGGIVIATFSGFAAYLTATGKNPNVPVQEATIFFESASGATGLAVAVGGVKRALTLRRSGNEKVFDMSKGALEGARTKGKRSPKQQPKVDRIRSYLRGLRPKTEEPSNLPADKPPAQPKLRQPTPKSAQRPPAPTVAPKLTPEKRLESTSYLHSFFRITQQKSSNYRAQQRQIANLTAEKDPTAYPAGIYEETNAIYRHITDHMLQPSGQRDWTIYNTKSKSRDPSGLSVAIALRRLGFDSKHAREQFANNSDTSSKGTARTRASLRSKDYRLTVYYEYDDGGTKVRLRVEPPRIPEKPSRQQPLRKKISLKKGKNVRAQPKIRGHSIGEGTRKRGIPGQ